MSKFDACFTYATVDVYSSRNGNPYKKCIHTVRMMHVGVMWYPRWRWTMWPLCGKKKKSAYIRHTIFRRLNFNVRKPNSLEEGSLSRNVTISLSSCDKLPASLSSLPLFAAILFCWTIVWAEIMNNIAWALSSTLSSTVVFACLLFLSNYLFAGRKRVVVAWV